MRKIPHSLPTTMSIGILFLMISSCWMTANAFCPSIRRIQLESHSSYTVENFPRSIQGTQRHFRHRPDSQRTSIMTRMNSKNDDPSNVQDQDITKDPSMNDCGGAVAGLFGNLRIPASLVAGASLGSAFGLPLAPTDGLVLGFVKRVYVLLMLASMSSMLLTVVLSTISMNDIALNPPRLAKSSADYIQRFYNLEWVLTKSNFLWGNIIFAIGSMLRGWVFISCPKVARGVLGVMGSFILISTSIVLEYSKEQSGKSLLEQASEFCSLIWSKMKRNPLFAIGTLIWVYTLIYLVSIVPQITEFLMHQEQSNLSP